jgi:hypothetical protein
VAGVKIEIDDEEWVGGVGVMARFEEWSAAINGICREKAPKPQNQRNVCMAQGRDYTVLRGFSRYRFAGQRHDQWNDGQRNGAPFSAGINGNGREKTRMAHTQGNVFDHIFPTKPPRIGEAVHVGKKGLRFAGSVLGFVQFGAVAEDGPVLKTLLEP